MGTMMIVVCCIPYSIKYRRILYISYIVFLILELLVLIAVVIIILAVDDLYTNDCSGYGNCEVDDALRTWYLIVVIVWACIYIPVGLVGLQIVYWGWKEQVERGDRKDDEKDEKKKKKAMEAQ